MLPSTAAAHPEVGAAGSDAHVTGLHESGDTPLSIRFTFLSDLNVHYIARGAIGHKHHHIVDACQGIALGGDVAYRDPLEQGIGFTFS